MDLNIIDKRLRAFEKKFRNLEKYVRSDDFATGRRIIAIILLAAGLVAGGVYLYQFVKLSNARVSRIDEALARDFPSYESPYCRWIYGQQPTYDDCLRKEQQSFTRFEATWHRSKNIADVREQMIACYSSAQNEQGVSWHTATECAELNQDLPETRKE